MFNLIECIPAGTSSILNTNVFSSSKFITGTSGKFSSSESHSHSIDFISVKSFSFEISSSIEPKSPLITGDKIISPTSIVSFSLPVISISEEPDNTIVLSSPFFTTALIVQLPTVRSIEKTGPLTVPFRITVSSSFEIAVIVISEKVNE